MPRTSLTPAGGHSEREKWAPRVNIGGEAGHPPANSTERLDDDSGTIWGTRCRRIIKTRKSSASRSRLCLLRLHWPLRDRLASRCDRSCSHTRRKRRLWNGSRLAGHRPANRIRGCYGADGEIAASQTVGASWPIHFVSAFPCFRRWWLLFREGFRHCQECRRRNLRSRRCPGSSLVVHVWQATLPGITRRQSTVTTKCNQAITPTTPQACTCSRKGTRFRVESDKLLCSEGHTAHS